MDTFSPVLCHMTPLCTNFQEIISVENQWQITETYDQDLVWNIVMSYLNYYPRNSDELDHRLRTLGVEKADKKIKNCITQYNPFLKRNAYFCDKIMDMVVKPFKRQIEVFVQQLSDSSIYSDEVCLENCAILLSCNILLVKKILNEEGHSTSTKLFPYCNSSMNIVLVIFQMGSADSDRESLTSPEDSLAKYSFGMSEKFGLIKQRIALKEILKLVKFPCNESFDDISRKILRLPDIQTDFLISLLKSDIDHYIPLIYKSSYVLNKLIDAGFSTDPTTENMKGESGLYLALCIDKISLLYFLYDYATNDCMSKEKSVRSPDESIVLKLKILRTYLFKLKDKLVAEGGKNLGKLEEIIRLNEFQTEVCSNINQLNIRYDSLINKYQCEVSELDVDKCEKVEYNSDKDFKCSEFSIDEHSVSKLNSKSNFSNEKTSKKKYSFELIYQAQNRSDTILSILKIYQNYFFWQSGYPVAHNLQTHIDEFCEHVYYFHYLDFLSIVMFFDKLFLLKERLDLPSSLYSQIESKFFFFLYSKKYLIGCNGSREEALDKTSKFIATQVRLDMKNEMSKFCKELEKIHVSQDNTLPCLPQKLVQTLTNLPLIYDEFILKRLVHYLDIAKDIEIKDSKSILIMERCLQVVGECLASLKIGFKSVRKILPLILPYNLKQNLLTIRNSLSHIDSKNVDYRSFVEVEIEMFKEMQTELKYISDAFIPILVTAHAYAMDKFVLSFMYKVVEKSAKEVKEKQNVELIHSTYENQTELIDSENRKKMRIECFKIPIQNMFISIKKEIEKNDFKRHNFSHMKLILNDYIWCVEFLLQYIATDERFENYQNILSRINLKWKNEFFLEDCETMNDSLSIGETDKINILLYNIIFEVSDISTIIKQAKSGGEKENVMTINQTNVQSCQFSEESNGNDIMFLKKKMMVVLEEYESVAGEMFDKIQTKPEFVTFDFRNISKLKEILSGKPFLKDKEKKELAKAKEKCKNIAFAKRRVELFLEGNSKLSEEELQWEISILKLSKKKYYQFFKSYRDSDLESCKSIIESVPNYAEELNNAIEKCEIDKNKCDHLCEVLEISAEEEAILKKLVKGQKRIECGNLLKFLNNRIELLKAILVDGDEDIKQLWVKAKSLKTKMFLAERITEFYLADPKAQAALEMLLVDSMNILNHQKLQYLWKKSSNLFSGINLRNILAHGNPLLETVGRLIDPYDLPSELVQNIIRLINDKSVIENLLSVSEQLKCDYDYLIRIIDINDSDIINGEISELCANIRRCDQWKMYAQLLKYSQENSR